MTRAKLETAVSIPSEFRYGEVSSLTLPRTVSSSDPSLGPLAAFTGTFTGNGFNTIFRPDSLKTPTPLPIPVTGGDNVLELNLTEETLSFSKSLGSVPNRGSAQQADVFLNGVPYLHSITAVTVPSQPVGIHLEPGLWMIVPSTTNPAEGVTLVRMASIPHGTTIQAQGTSTTIGGKPTIPAVDITPFTTAAPNTKVPFPSQTATNNNTARIPQNLAPFIAAGTITHTMLTDPNTLLRNHIASQNITSTITIVVSTNPNEPLFGGGTNNIAFLLGNAAALTNPAAAGPNAQVLQMTAAFWIETVQYVIEVPIFKLGQPPLTIPGETGEAGQPAPKFLVNPPIEIMAPRKITVTSTQIQYSQTVFLNFNGLTWPHVSVATLVPSDAIPVPPSAYTQMAISTAVLENRTVPSNVSEIVLARKVLVDPKERELMQITVYRDDPPYYIAEWDANFESYGALFNTIRLLHEELAARFDFPLAELAYTVRVSPETNNEVFSNLREFKLVELNTFLSNNPQPSPRVVRIDGPFFGISQEDSVACFTSSYKLPDSLAIVWSASRPDIGNELGQEYIKEAIKDIGIDWNRELHERLYGKV